MVFLIQTTISMKMEHFLLHPECVAVHETHFLLLDVVIVDAAIAIAATILAIEWQS